MEGTTQMPLTIDDLKLKKKNLPTLLPHKKPLFFSQRPTLSVIHLQASNA